MSAGEDAARYAKEERASFADAGRRYGVSRERVRQVFRRLYGSAPDPVTERRTQTDRQIADLAEAGLCQVEIAEMAGVSVHVVSNAKSRLGLTVVDGNENRVTTPETRSKIIELARGGSSAAEIGLATGVGYRLVRKWCAELGISTNGKSGKRAGLAAAASAMMDRTRCNMHRAANAFAVSPSSVFFYRKRRGLPTVLRG